MRSQDAVVHPQPLLRREKYSSVGLFGRGGEFQIGLRMGAGRHCRRLLQPLVETVSQDGVERRVIPRR